MESNNQTINSCQFKRVSYMTYRQTDIAFDVLTNDYISVWKKYGQNKGKHRFPAILVSSRGNWNSWLKTLFKIAQYQWHRYTGMKSLSSKRFPVLVLFHYLYSSFSLVFIPMNYWYNICRQTWIFWIRLKGMYVNFTVVKFHARKK